MCSRSAVRPALPRAGARGRSGHQALEGAQPEARRAASALLLSVVVVVVVVVVMLHYYYGY